MFLRSTATHSLSFLSPKLLLINLLLLLGLQGRGLEPLRANQRLIVLCLLHYFAFKPPSYLIHFLNWFSHSGLMVLWRLFLAWRWEAVWRETASILRECVNCCVRNFREKRRRKAIFHSPRLNMSQIRFGDTNTNGPVTLPASHFILHLIFEEKKLPLTIAVLIKAWSYERWEASSYTHHCTLMH